MFCLEQSACRDQAYTAARMNETEAPTSPFADSSGEERGVGLSASAKATYASAVHYSSAA